MTRLPRYSEIQMLFQRAAETMSKNKSRQMQKAVRFLDNVLDLDEKDPHALPGSVVKQVKSARKTLLRDIRKRREGTERESFKRGA